MQKCNKNALTDTESREGCRAASSGLTQTVPKDSKNQGDGGRDESWAPVWAKDLVSESVSSSLTDKVTAVQLEPVTAEVQDQAVDTADKAEAEQERKFSVAASAKRDKARPRTAGEPPSSNPQMWNNSPLRSNDKLHKQV